MQQNINFTIKDSITPEILLVQAKIDALAEILCNTEQLQKFHDGTIKHLKELFSELVEKNPHLLEEAPELKEFLK